MGQGFGAFGKMPNLGDFFHLNPPPGFVRGFDEWVQGAMRSSAQSAGEDWDTQYMSAPIWRFGFAAGLAGPSKIIGILMPSVDRVGRRFPLALMANVDGDGSIATDHMTSSATFDKLEDIALAALDDSMNKDQLARLLGEIDAPLGREPSAVRKVGDTFVLSHSHPDRLAQDVASGLFEIAGLRQPSLWSTILDGRCRALVCDGLPKAHQASALFDMNAPIWGDARSGS
ncbi:MAG: type VI secretion system-associated protein TagF [Sulfitobacter sp.]